MKKKFGKLFIILGVILCIFALVGCDLILGNNPDPEKNSAEESSSESSKISEESTEETTEETWQNGPIEVEDNELIAELLDYLNDLLTTHHDHITKTMEEKIDDIKAGDQALHFAFDADCYYFVCGYLNPAHEGGEGSLCCRENYTWVRYHNENEIQEYYDGEKFAVAFQINKTLFVTDILPSDKKTPKMEHYQLYYPEFVDGYNVHSAENLKLTGIYINPSNSKNVYYNMYKWNGRDLIINCVYHNYRYYVIEKIWYKNSAGGNSHPNYKNYYGKYYDVIMEAIIAERGLASISDPGITFYGLIPICDFANEVLK